MRSKKNNKRNISKTNRKKYKKTKKQNKTKKVMKGGMFIKKKMYEQFLAKMHHEMRVTRSSKPPIIDQFKYVLYMLDLPCKVEILNYTSLTGFIFKITVSNEVKETDLPFEAVLDGKKITAYSIVLKIAVLSHSPERILLPNPEKLSLFQRYLPSIFPPPGTIIKNTEISEEFDLESRIQKYIYRTTLHPNGIPSCLSVIDYSTFDSDTAKVFLDNLLKKVDETDATTKFIIQNIIMNIWNKQLGVISMELADSSFISLRTANQQYKALIKRCCFLAIAHLFVIFLKTGGIVNADLHEGNILVNIEKDTGTVRSVKIIDFGRTVRISSMEDFFSRQIKNKYKERMVAIKRMNNVEPTKMDFKGINLYYEYDSSNWFDMLIAQMVGLERSRTPEQKLNSISFLNELNEGEEDEIIKRVVLLLHVLSELDFAYNSITTNSRKYQMDFLLKCVFGDLSIIGGMQTINWYNDNLSESVKLSAMEIFKAFKELVTIKDHGTRNLFSVGAINNAAKKGRFTGSDSLI